MTVHTAQVLLLAYYYDCCGWGFCVTTGMAHCTRRAKSINCRIAAPPGRQHTGVQVIRPWVALFVPLLFVISTTARVFSPPWDRGHAEHWRCHDGVKAMQGEVGDSQQSSAYPKSGTPYV